MLPTRRLVQGFARPVSQAVRWFATGSDEVGTRKVMEDAGASVWEMVLKPGEKSSFHTHKRGYYYYIMEGSKMSIQNEQGKELELIDMQAGECYGWEIQGDDLVCTTKPSLRVPVSHQAENVGSGTFREILFEPKK
eukprot:GDKH01024732.1.p1 GENE.GDKH01024732.1~~GDKH01024732.1.p1  ORF type:complete len:136 (-),score=14.95 GDKH01024732.1:121-528(-)